MVTKFGKMLESEAALSTAVNELSRLVNARNVINGYWICTVLLDQVLLQFFDRLLPEETIQYWAYEAGAIVTTRGCRWSL